MKTRLFFQRLTTPAAWTIQGVYSEVLDKWFTQKMDEGYLPAYLTYSTVTFAGQIIWVGNRYYCSPRIETNRKELMPYPKTAKRFFKLVDTMLLTKEEQDLHNADIIFKKELYDKYFK